MASTRSLQDVINWAQPYCRLIGLTGQGGVANEPAMSIANSVLCFILGAPFAWRWNRNSLTFNTASGTQIYQQSAPDFGWLEKGTVNDGVTIWEVEPRLILPDATDQGKPIQISADIDDDNGNITFKLYPVPSAVYSVKVVYQKKPVLFTTLSSVWSPIPDEYQHLYNTGFLAGALEAIDDSRFAFEYQKHVRTVIAANEGLTDTQKSMFLADKLVAMREQEYAQMGPQQGRSARGGI